VSSATCSVSTEHTEQQSNRAAEHSAGHVTIALWGPAQILCLRLLLHYDLVICYGGDGREDRLAVSNTVLQPALDALISLNNVGLKAVSLLVDELLRRAECTFALAAHCRHCEQVVSHNSKRWIEVFTSFTPPTDWLHILRDNPAILSCCNARVKDIGHKPLELARL
jgi:hypothetical protein